MRSSKFHFIVNVLWFHTISGKTQTFQINKLVHGLTPSLWTFDNFIPFQKKLNISDKLPCSWFNTIKLFFLSVIESNQHVHIWNRQDSMLLWICNDFIHFSRIPHISGQLPYKCFNTINITHFHVSLDYFKMLLTYFPDIMW